jgi:ribA/ribD-fused uncharacterized protein
MSDDRSYSFEGAGIFGPFAAVYEPDGELGILSNFAEVPVFLEDIEWPTAEHFFHAQKFLREEHRAIIIATETGSEAKAAAWSEALSGAVRGDWDEIRLAVMRRALLAKFGQSAVALNMLRSTWPLPIVENSPADEFWGIGASGNGANWLGRLLEEAREHFGCERSPLTLARNTKLNGTGGSSKVRWAALELTPSGFVTNPPLLAYEGFLRFDVSEMLAQAHHQGRQQVEVCNVTKGQLAHVFDVHAAILDQKYSRYRWHQDSRSAIVNWKLQFLGVLATSCKEGFDDLRIIVVGAGSANETSHLWRGFSSRAILVDWGVALVENCRKEAPEAVVRRCRAEHLEHITDECADVYCALRTFDSALIDVEAALHEAWRVVRRGGSILLSISNGYLARDGVVATGQITKAGKLDRFRPWEIYLNIANIALGMGFVTFNCINLGSEIVLSFERPG